MGDSSPKPPELRGPDNAAPSLPEALRGIITRHWGMLCNSGRTNHDMKGSYALVLRLDQRREIRVGRLWAAGLGGGVLGVFRQRAEQPGRVSAEAPGAGQKAALAYRLPDHGCRRRRGMVGRGDRTAGVPVDPVVPGMSRGGSAGSKVWVVRLPHLPSPPGLRG